MPRRPRVASGGYVYHVLNRAAGRMQPFTKERDFEAFEQVIAEAKARLPMVESLGSRPRRRGGAAGRRPAANAPRLAPTRAIAADRGGAGGVATVRSPRRTVWRRFLVSFRELLLERFTLWFKIRLTRPPPCRRGIATRAQMQAVGRTAAREDLLHSEANPLRIGGDLSPRVSCRIRQPADTSGPRGASRPGSQVPGSVGSGTTSWPSATATCSQCGGISAGSTTSR